MTFTIAAFRAAFPEFANAEVYPNAMITFWSTLAQELVCKDIWCRLWLQGVYLYVAHQITLAAQNVQIAGNGGEPGTSGGVPDNKTVGSVSVGYNSTVTSFSGQGYEGAAFWNLTNYGKNFYTLVLIVGMRPIQL